MTRKLIFVGAIALICTSFYISSEHFFTEHIRGEGTRINMAGQLRFRSFRIGWMLHRLVEKNDQEVIESIKKEIETFENIAGALKNGNNDLGVEQIDGRDKIGELDALMHHWKSDIKPLIVEILEDPDKSKPVLQRYDSTIDPFVMEINDFVGLLERDFNEKMSRFDIFRGYALGLFALVSLFIVFYIRNGIIKPLSALKDAATEIGKGNYGTRIKVKGDDDIKFLAETINEMALGIEGSITNLEELVQQRTAEIEASNEELQSSYIQLEETTEELQRASQELAKANEELKGLDRLKNDFLHTISHELRSPLSPILGYLEILREGGVGELTSKQKDIMAEMHICGRNMQMIIDELLEVASIQAGNISLEFKEVDLHPILLYAVKDVRKYAEEISVEIVVGVPEDPILLIADRKSLVGIFIHLLRNAVKFSRNGGKITVEAITKDNGVQVTVSDRGIGIPHDKLDKIFDVFYQVDSSEIRRYEGVGLGLSLVKKLVDLHKGTISVVSREGEGATFTVFIPKNRG